MSFNFDMLNNCVSCGKVIGRTQAQIGMRNTGEFHLSCWNELPAEQQKRILGNTK